MIELTRLNGNAMMLNSDLIKTVEASPDTMLTLINGRKADCARTPRRGYRAGTGLSRALAVAGGAPASLLRWPATRSVHCSLDVAEEPAAPQPKLLGPLTTTKDKRFLLPHRACLGAIHGQIEYCRSPPGGFWDSGRLVLEGGNLGQILPANRGADRSGRHDGRCTAAVSHRHGDGGIPQPRARIFRAEEAERRANYLLLSFANKARRNGVVSLDADLKTLHDPFLKRALMLAVDGTDPSELRKIMRVSLDSTMEREEQLPMVFESAGGFSPTHWNSWSRARPDSGDGAS